MFRWLIRSVVAAALVCPAVNVRAQDQPPADDPAPAAEQEARDAARQARAEALQAAREAQQAQIREMTQRARELAEVRAQIQVDGVGGQLGRARVAVRARETEKAAWLGVSTSKVPPALRQHLQLQNRYIGLLVERVEPESPAAQAGLEQFDIIEKLGDQWIVNTEQFSVVLRLQDPGDEVTLSIIRKGQPQQITATLAEREVPVLGAGEFQFFDAAAMGGGGEGNAWFHVAPQGHVVIRDPAGFEPLMQFRRLNEMENSQVVIKDDEHTLKMTTRQGERTLVASDADGVVIFDGPINTDEEREQIPDEIRTKVEKMLESPPIPAPAPPAPPVRE